MAGAAALSAAELEAQQNQAAAGPPAPSAPISYPRVFSGRHLRMVAFPLGGVGAGAVSLGGRGQLRDWEIFNRPDKGNAPSYAFPAIWVQAGNGLVVSNRIYETSSQGIIVANEPSWPSGPFLLLSRGIILEGRAHIRDSCSL